MLEFDFKQLSADSSNILYLCALMWKYLAAIFKADSHVTQSRWNVTFRGKPPYRPKGGFSWADCFGSLVQIAILSQL